MKQVTEINVMTTPGAKAAYLKLVPEFERATGYKAAMNWLSSVEMMRRLKDGEIADLVILPAASIDELDKLGKISAGSRVDLVKMIVGVAVRAGAPRPDIGSGDALKRALLAAHSIALSNGPSGVYLAALTERMGIAEKLKSKILWVQGAVGEVIARGEAELGFQQVSELLPVAGIDLVGPLSDDVQLVTILSAGLHVGSQQIDAANALIAFLTAPAAHPVLKAAGLEPA
jgi:molybdate transport system substrate-binding protein